MSWLISNIDLIIGILIILLCAILAIYKFIMIGKEAQIEKVKEWLLFICTMAEKELGNKTGQLKLRWCYDKFIEKFTFVSMLITFEQFSELVDEVLDSMRDMIEKNESIKAIVEKKEPI